MKKRTTKRLKELMWEECKRIVRTRDKHTCQRCGKHVEGFQSHTSHVIPKSHGNILRFDVLNLKVLCFSCHNWWHGAPLQSSEWFCNKFPKRYEYLMEKQKDQRPIKRADLEEIYKKLKEV